MARRVLHDKYFKQAKAEGYLARSAYKLAEINERKRLIRRGDRVLDLGCSPGAWLQVAREIVGERGVVVGVDLKPAHHSVSGIARTIVGDAREIDPAELVGEDGALFNVVLSDMAPNTTGAGDDHRSARLCDEMLDRLPDLLTPGGAIAMKVLEGGGFPDLLVRARGEFGEAKPFKPKASRDVSREIYLVGRRYKGPRPGRGA